MQVNNNLQILRGLAAALIVLVHINELLLKNFAPYWFSATLFSGVDVFFVISGFIISKSISRNRYSALEFVFHRWLRVAPLYYLLTVFVFVVAYFYPSLLKTTTADISGLLKSIAFIPYEKSEGRIYPLYYVGWSLNYEMFFYFLCFLNLFFIKKINIYFVEVTVFVLVLLGFYFSPKDIYENFGVLGYFFTRPIMISFVFGMLIARYDYFFEKFLSNKNVVLIFSLVVSVCAMFASQIYFPIGNQSLFLPDTSSAYYFSIPAAIIVVAVLNLKIRSSGIVDLMVRLGDSSYSLYLSHYFIVAVTGVLVNRYFDNYKLMASVLCFFIVIWVANLVHFYVERRLSNFIRLKFSGSKK